MSKSCLKKYLLLKILFNKKILINLQFEDKAFVEDSIIVEIPPGCLSKDKIHKFWKILIFYSLTRYYQNIGI